MIFSKDKPKNCRGCAYKDICNTVVLAGHKYLFYDCLIMKSTEKGLKAIPADEIDTARNAFKKQTGRYQVGPFEFLAYRIS